MQKVPPQRQFWATATPGQSWPADGGHHIDVVRLTTADMQNSSSYRQLEALHGAGNGAIFGASFPNRRSVPEHRLDETTVQPLNETTVQRKRLCFQGLNFGSLRHGQESWIFRCSQCSSQAKAKMVSTAPRPEWCP